MHAGAGWGGGARPPFLKGRVSTYKELFYPSVISSANMSQVPTLCQVTGCSVSPVATKTGLLNSGKMS